MIIREDRKSSYDNFISGPMEGLLRYNKIQKGLYLKEEMENVRSNKKRFIDFPVMEEPEDSGWINEVKCTKLKG